MSRHIYATAIYYALDPAVETVNSTLSINSTMIGGLFDTTETINYATGINNLT